MRYIVYLLMVFVLWIVQQGLLPVIISFKHLPNLGLLFALVLAIQKQKGSYFFGILAALLLEFSVNVFPGAYLLAFVIMIYATRMVFNKLIFSEKAAKYLVAVVVLSTIFMQLWVFNYNKLMVFLRVSGAVEVKLPPVESILILCLLHIICLYPIFFSNQLLERRFTRRALSRNL